jgi:hypothetical protein
MPRTFDDKVFNEILEPAKRGVVEGRCVGFERDAKTEKAGATMNVCVV